MEENLTDLDYRVPSCRVMSIVVDILKKSEFPKDIWHDIVISDMKLKPFLDQCTEVFLEQFCEAVDNYEMDVEEPFVHVLVDDIKTELQKRVPGYEPLFGFLIKGFLN